ncbi:MAG: GNAT family N-acetyltransferase [Alphaproteobacteria bacterium]
MAQAFAIRVRVFVREQGVTEEIELDRDDRRAIHFLAFAGPRAVGTARVVWHHGSTKIGRMAVLKRYRGRGVGKKLLKRTVAAAQRTEAQKQRSEVRGQKSDFKNKKPLHRGARTIYLHAQVPVIGFYESMGFRCVGRIFDEAGIPHRKMILKSRSSPKPIKPPIRPRSIAE